VGYVAVAHGAWRVWGTPEWIEHVPALVAASAASAGGAGEAAEARWMHRSKHARTRRVEVGGRQVYVKAYHRYRWRDVLAQAVRPTKAEHALRVSVRLEEAGFRVPRPVACGVQRRWGIVLGAFFVAEAVEARDVRCVITDLGSRHSPADKRWMLRRLGAEVGALHEAGVYHGDLVPPNVRVRGEAEDAELFFMDHDRTRVRRRAVSLRQARRNLVQLNRFVVPALTATDRWRVFRAYCQARGLGSRVGRRLARRVVRGTVQRRRVLDGIEQAGRMSFRMLMRPSGPVP
jgi:tRNA A-37 threonylcarbamoyl transferase component Bud32